MILEEYVVKIVGDIVGIGKNAWRMKMLCF